MRVRRTHAAACVAVAAAVLCGVAPAVASADGATATKRVSIAGKSQSGERFGGSYRIERVVRAADGTVYAIADLRGRVGGREVLHRQVKVAGAFTPIAHTAQIPPTPGACQVLSLTLGPLDLNLLGLRVRLSRVDLLIEAIPGGGLLGDLLCSIAARGETPTGADFSGTFALRRFTARAGRLYAVGRLHGRVAHRRLARSVRIPALRRLAQIPPTPGACQVLSLTLGPLDLNLLGLRVRLSRVDLRIEAIPGGGLLGDLLCGLTGGPTAGLTAGSLAQALNERLGLGRPAHSP